MLNPLLQTFFLLFLIKRLSQEDYVCDNVWINNYNSKVREKRAQ